MFDVTNAWDRIDGWLSEHAPASADSLAPPATREEIAAAEAELGFAFPPPLVESLLRHNGTTDDYEVILPFFTLLSASRIVEEYRKCAATAAEDDAFTQPSNSENGEPWWHERWIPFGRSDGDHHVIDARPGPAQGRLGFSAHDDEGDFRYAWPSVGAFLTVVADALDTGGAYFYGPFEGVRPVVNEREELWWTKDASAGSDHSDGLRFRRVPPRATGPRWPSDLEEWDEAQPGDLLTLLAGYPRPMAAVLTRLLTTDVSDVLADLRGGRVIDHRSPEARRALEYGDGALDPALHAGLLLLAPFDGAYTVDRLEKYRQTLLRTEAAPYAEKADLPAAVKELERVLLADRGGQPVSIVGPFLGYCLRDEPDLVDALWQAHYEFFRDAVAPEIYRLLTSGSSKEREEGRDELGFEYDNLAAAIDHGEECGLVVFDLVLPLQEFYGQSQQHESRRAVIDAVLTTHPDEPDRRAEFAVLHRLAGDAALRLRRTEEARRHHQREFDLYEALGRRRDLAGVHKRLGRVAEEDGLWDEAQRHHREALNLDEEFGDRHAAAGARLRLGVVAQARGEQDKASEEYRRALAGYEEFADRYGAAGVHHRFGTLAEQNARWDEAGERYRRALETFTEFGDGRRAARAAFRLGAIAQEQGEWRESERHYEAALRLQLEADDRLPAAETSHRLSVVGVKRLRWDEAERHLQQALDLYEEYDDAPAATETRRQLAELIEQRDRHLDTVHGRRR